jgi:phosphomannomutase/phosphoglucomutase
VIDVGCVPTPLTYFAAYELGTNSCVSVTGSHNPPDYNGLKMVLGGQTLFGELIQALRQRIIDGNLVTAAVPASSPRPTWCPPTSTRSSATSSSPAR